MYMHNYSMIGQEEWLAQVAESHLGKINAVGSNPVWSNIFSQLQAMASDGWKETAVIVARID